METGGAHDALRRLCFFGTAVIRCLVFDMDDTLYPERDYVRSGFDASAQILPPEIRTHVAKACWDEFNDGSRLDIFDRVLGRFALHDPGLVSRLVAAYREHIPAIVLDPSAIFTLARARAAKCFLGVITDGRSLSQHAKIAALGLKDVVDAIICTDDLGREFWKPHPRAFALMAEMARAQPWQCAYVGDNPRKDFIAPNALGWSTVMYRRSGAVHDYREMPVGGEPHWKVTALPDLLALLGIEPSEHVRAAPDS